MFPDTTMPDITKCPECGSEDVYDAECDDLDCSHCGSLHTYCRKCGWTDHPDCPVNSDESE